jgi:hypothetical protein
MYFIKRALGGTKLEGSSRDKILLLLRYSIHYSERFFASYCSHVTCRPSHFFGYSIFGEGESIERYTFTPSVGWLAMADTGKESCFFVSFKVTERGNRKSLSSTILRCEVFMWRHWCYINTSTVWRIASFWNSIHAPSWHYFSQTSLRNNSSHECKAITDWLIWKRLSQWPSSLHRGTELTKPLYH